MNILEKLNKFREVAEALEGQNGDIIAYVEDYIDKHGIPDSELGVIPHDIIANIISRHQELIDIAESLS